MKALPILKMGDPRLYRVAEPLGPPSSAAWTDLPHLVEDMQASLDAAGGIGLAAPQIGINLRVVIISVPKMRMADDPHWPQGVPQTVVVDPVITVQDDTEMMDWEACLSVPGLTGYVPRPTAVRLTGWTADGDALDWCATGYHARVILHECDHLDGVLYPQRLHSYKDLLFTSERSKWLAHEKND